MNHNLYQLLQSRFPRTRNKPFLQTAYGNLSYEELDHNTKLYAAVLKHQGVRKGDRVVVQVEKSSEAVILYLACLRAGAIYIPLNTAYTISEVRYFLQDAQPRLVVCDPAREDEFTRQCNELSSTNLLTLDGNGQGSLVRLASNVDGDATISHCEKDDLAAILYTSGTTGRSKGAMLSHENLASNALVLHKYWQWQEGDVLLHALPIYHVHGLFVALHCALLNGSAVLFHSSFDANRVVEDLPKSTVFMGVPTFYTRMLEQTELNRDDCQSMRLFIAGSAPLLEESFNQFYRRTGHKILERYGMSEAGMITSNPYGGDRLAGTVGFPLPGVSARVADENGVEVPRGNVGVLEITGPNVFSGYWKMPEKTAEEFRPDGYFITGDMAVMEETGRVSIVGRAKDLVISGGFNVYPKEVESVIDAIPGVKESAVIGVPHPDFGEGVVAIIVGDEGSQIDAAVIRGYLGDLLAKFKQPKAIRFVDELPRNAMGKVQKKLLREAYENLFKSSAPT